MNNFSAEGASTALRGVKDFVSPIVDNEETAQEVNASLSAPSFKSSTFYSIATAVVLSHAAISAAVAAPTTINYSQLHRHALAAEVSDRSKLLDKIRSFSSYVDNWDGYGGHAASTQAVANATAIVRLIPSNLPLPRAGLSGDGAISLFWESEGIFIDLGFYGNDAMTYYAEVDFKGKFFGEDVPVGAGIPAEVHNILNNA